MKVEIDNFIGVFDNTVTNEYCDFLIDFFNRMQNIGKAVSRKEYENIVSTKKDNSLYFFINEEDPLIINQQNSQLHPFVETIQKCYEIYV